MFRHGQRRLASAAGAAVGGASIFGALAFGGWPSASSVAHAQAAPAPSVQVPVLRAAPAAAHHQDHSIAQAYATVSAVANDASAAAAASVSSPSSSAAAVALGSGSRSSSLQLSTPPTQSEMDAAMSKFVDQHVMTEQQAQQCEEWKQKAIHQSRKVNYMFRAMKRLGCTVDPQTFITCIACHPHASGGTALQEDSVDLFMCGNGIRSWDQFETVLTHELLHAYDHCRADIDPSNLQHHACMEVRAANLSGDCAFKREAKIGELEITNHQPKCVRRRAVMSLLANPGIDSVEQAQAIVESVYDRCAADTEPFGSIPW